MYSKYCVCNMSTVVYTVYSKSDSAKASKRAVVYFRNECEMQEMTGFYPYLVQLYTHQICSVQTRLLSAVLIGLLKNDSGSDKGLRQVDIN